MSFPLLWADGFRRPLFSAEIPGEQRGINVEKRAKERLQAAPGDTIPPVPLPSMKTIVNRAQEEQ